MGDEGKAPSPPDVMEWGAEIVRRVAEQLSEDESPDDETYARWMHADDGEEQGGAQRGRADATHDSSFSSTAFSSAGMRLFERSSESAMQSWMSATMSGEMLPHSPTTPPCKHNAWRRLRRPRKLQGVLLRCLVCSAHWATQKELHKKCGDFYKGRCKLGVACPHPHVYARGAVPEDVVTAQRQAAAEEAEKSMDAASARKLEILAAAPLRQQRDDKQKRRKETRKEARRLERSQEAMRASQSAGQGAALASHGQSTASSMLTAESSDRSLCGASMHSAMQRSMQQTSLLNVPSGE